MKIYVLTSVALFAEYGDLDSLDAPSVNVTLHLSLDAARAQMEAELEAEKNDAEKSGYETFDAELNDTNASYKQEEIGNGCSYNLVQWEITEKDFDVKTSPKHDDSTFFHYL